MKAYINAISYYLPEQILSNHDLVKDFPEWSVEKVAGKIGIDKRHVAGKNETSADLAVAAAQKLFAEHKINPADIDFVILCTQSPDYFLPTSSCIIQHKLGIPVGSGAIDYNQGCSGFVYGLALAKGLIAGGVAKNILLLTSETYSKFIHPKDKTNRTIFGDAAAATLVSTEGTAEILHFSLGTDGSGANNLIVKTGGMRHPDKVNDLAFDEALNPVSSDHLFMNGTEIFNFTLENVPVLVDMTLERNNILKDDISLFVFHQANRYMLNFLRKKTKIPQEKFYEYIAEVGNTVSSTIPICLYHAEKESKIRKNDFVLLAGFGVGYSWAGCVLKFTR